MPVYTCEKCGKEFKNNSSFKRHMNRKTPCKKVIDEDGVEETVESNNDNIIEKKIDIISKENNKKELGQFYTTNYEYILQNLSINSNISNIIEPFAGNGDLLNFFDKSKYNIECYDIDPKKKYIIKRDTLRNPPDFNNKFIITNPPYLSRNKSNNKSLYDLYDTNDLYKCFIKIIIKNKCLGGILIIPLNFFSSIRNSDINLRKKFIEIYDIKIINIFEENVFNDTSYTVCSFQFIKKNIEEKNEIKCFIYPSKKQIFLDLNINNNYTFGGEIYNLKKTNKYCITRATKFNIDKNNISNIVIKCIDNNINNKIKLFYVKNNSDYIDNTQKSSNRTYARLIIIPKLSLYQQKKIINEFNNFINIYRDKYNSLFLTNYRESNSIARKRISFKLSFDIISHLLLIGNY